jgi:hypothetical protein
MPTVNATKSYPFSKFFKEWRTCKGEDAVLAARMTPLRDNLRDAVKELGEEIDGGHFVWYFKTPIKYTDPALPGKPRVTHVYTGLKAEKRLVPSAPVPDPELAEALLKKKNLWMTQEQENALAALQISCPNVAFTAEVDIDAVATLYKRGKLSEKEYESTLEEQKIQWAFVPIEAK